MNGVGKRMGRQCPSGARNAWSHAMAHQPTWLLEVSYAGLAHPRYQRRERKTARARNQAENEQPRKSQDRGKDGIRTHLQRRGCTTAQTCVQGIAELKQRRDAPWCRYLL